MEGGRVKGSDIEFIGQGGEIENLKRLRRERGGKDKGKRESKKL